MRFSCRFGLVLGLNLALTLLCIAWPALAAPLTVTVRANHGALHNTPIVAAIASARRALVPAGSLEMKPADGGAPIPAQRLHGPDGDSLLFVEPDLPAGKARTYTLRAAAFDFPKNPGAFAHLNQGDVEIYIGRDGIDLLTRYTMKRAPNKPVFYPLVMADGSPIMRAWPVEPDLVPGESRDHPHHRGLWFTHSSVNGIDFWTEQGKGIGRTATTGVSGLQSGPVAGAFEAATEWRGPDNQLVATDTRRVLAWRLPDGDRVLDFEIMLRPAGAPVVFGDNKDGVFGLRVPDSLALKPDKSSKIKGEGHIRTATGNSDEAAWSKPADWVDYYGPMGGATGGVAIFDHPANFRHPTTWHARDYGLFTANPFGLHDFGRGPKGAGDYTLAVGKTLSLRYRVLFHHGDTAAARVAEQYTAYSTAPAVEIR